MNGISSRGQPLGGYISENEHIVSQLERGTLITKFFPRKRPERKTLKLRRETSQLIWTRPSTTPNPTGQKNTYEGAVEIREIKEIRLGKNSKDFEKWPDDSKKMENLKCFVVFYGSEFKLRTLSVAGNLLFSINLCS